MNDSNENKNVLINILLTITSIVGIGVLAYLLPLMEIFQMFLFVVVVPIMVLAMTGVISKNAYSAVSEGLTQTIDWARKVTEDGLEDADGYEGGEVVYRTKPATKQA